MKTRYLFGMPLITIDVAFKELELLLDTGFNGSLLFPVELIEQLHLSKIGVSDCVMADGSRAATGVYILEIDWFDKKKKVSVLGVDSDLPLLGMELLQNARVIFEPSKNILSINESV